MSEVLRQHIQRFGFTHSEIARRSARLNQATAYRVVEGETSNPSLKSITGIVEAVTLTDADAGVLYRRMGGGQAQPRRHQPPNGISNHEEAARYTKNKLDTGCIRAAAYGVMAMFDLATTDEQLCDAYEQAGIVYMGLGLWEEAQVNFEAADSHLQYNIDDPCISQKQIDRKHTLMTNIGSLMVKRGNSGWARVFAKSVIEHRRVSEMNCGWGHLVLGEVELYLQSYQQAAQRFSQALSIFQSILERLSSSADAQLTPGLHRVMLQAKGNIRWAEIHLAKSQLLMGELVAAQHLQAMEAEWMTLDPEASAMAGLFYAEQVPHKKRRKLLLNDLKQRARRHGLGEVLQRIAAFGCAVLFTAFVSSDIPAETHKTSVQPPRSGQPISPENGVSRGNTGG